MKGLTQVKNQKPYACPVCDRKFAQITDIKNHERTHTGEKPYGCVYCDKTFARKYVMNKHERTHTGEKP